MCGPNAPAEPRCEYIDDLLSRQPSIRGEDEDTGPSDHAPALATLALDWKPTERLAF